MTEHDLERDTSLIDWEKVAKEVGRTKTAITEQIPGRSSIDVKIRWLGMLLVVVTHTCQEMMIQISIMNLGRKMKTRNY